MFTCGLAIGGCAQAKIAAEKEVAYNKTIELRSEKIVATLGIADSNKAKYVSGIIAQQYHNLNNIHSKEEGDITALKNQPDAGKELYRKEKEKIENFSARKLEKLHRKYLKKLSKELSEEQVSKVKDGMTYGVLPITYKAYQDMIPTLTEPQKEQILTWLTEAREYAMDAGSSEQKHAWFGKYKGRINNYLSAQGYDSKKERAQWEMRLKAVNKE